jgi:hypothetical protein
MDEAWRAMGIKNPMEFFRGAIGHYLAHLGARDAAALFTTRAPRGRERGGIARDEAPSPIMRLKRPSNRHLPCSWTPGTAGGRDRDPGALRPHFDFA